MKRHCSLGWTLALALLLAGCGSSNDNPSSSADTISFISVSPTNGSTVGGDTITVTGTLFVSGMTVNLNDIPCTNISVLSSTQLTCVTPAGSTGSATIRLGDNSNNFAFGVNAFTYGNVGPTFTSVNPPGFIVTQSTQVTIQGSGFVDDISGTTTVTVDGVACTSVAVNSASEIVCNSPTSGGGAGAGNADIVITNPDAQFVTAVAAFELRTPPTYSELTSSGANGVFFNNCNSCHGSSGGMDIDVYSSISLRISAFDPVGSLLWQRINGIGNLMPQGGPALSAGDIELITDWIEDGAQNN